MAEIQQCPDCGGFMMATNKGKHCYDCLSKALAEAVDVLEYGTDYVDSLHDLAPKPDLGNSIEGGLASMIQKQLAVAANLRRALGMECRAP